MMIWRYHGSQRIHRPWKCLCTCRKSKLNFPEPQRFVFLSYLKEMALWLPNYYNANKKNKERLCPGMVERTACRSRSWNPRRSPTHSSDSAHVCATSLVCFWTKPGEKDEMGAWVTSQFHINNWRSCWRTKKNLK